MASSYIDFYMIGAQKSATSELCMRLGHLKVWRKGMEKEWHFFEKLEEPGMKFRTALHMPYTPAELQNLRSEHYKSGFPGSENGEVPVIDDANVNNRSVVYDATVEYMLSDRVAFLAHALTPHAKIVMTIREPLDRALSQYNMMTRLYNTARREKGESDVAASARQFHEIIVREISKLKTCGYDAETGNVDRATSELLKCMYADGKFDFEDLLYVTRGLYHMHILAWRNYFPDHRMMFISFADIASGERKTMNEFTDFLCVRRFGEDLLERYKERGSSVSFGRQAAEKGLNRMGFESYEGKDKYLVEVLPETRAVVDEFYKGANRRLEALLGRKMF